MEETCTPRQYARRFAQLLEEIALFAAERNARYPVDRHDNEFMPEHKGSTLTVYRGGICAYEYRWPSFGQIIFHRRADADEAAELFGDRAAELYQIGEQVNEYRPEGEA